MKLFLPWPLSWPYKVLSMCLVLISTVYWFHDIAFSPDPQVMMHLGKSGLPDQNYLWVFQNQIALQQHFISWSMSIFVLGLFFSMFHTHIHPVSPLVLPLHVRPLVHLPFICIHTYTATLSVYPCSAFPVFGFPPHPCRSQSPWPTVKTPPHSCLPDCLLNLVASPVSWPLLASSTVCLDFVLFLLSCEWFELGFWCSWFAPIWFMFLYPLPCSPLCSLYFYISLLLLHPCFSNSCLSLLLFIIWLAIFSPSHSYFVTSCFQPYFNSGVKVSST